MRLLPICLAACCFVAGQDTRNAPQGGQIPGPANQTDFAAWLGLTVGCAECHNHPFAKWKPNDFWGTAAFFGKVQYGGKGGPPALTESLAGGVSTTDALATATSLAAQTCGFDRKGWLRTGYDADLLITGHIPCENGYDTPNDRQLILDCLSTPAAICLFPTDRPLTFQELVGYVEIL